MSLALEEINSTQLEFAEGIAYRKDHQGKIPFSGVVVNYYPNGQKQNQIFYRDGRRHGKETSWYLDGELEYLVRYKEGQLQAQGSSWYAKNQDQIDVQDFMTCNEPDASEAICGEVKKEPFTQYFMACSEPDASAAICGGLKEEPALLFELCTNGSC